MFFFLLKRLVDKALFSAYYFLLAEHDFISVLLFFFRIQLKIFLLPIPHSVFAVFVCIVILSTTMSNWIWKKVPALKSLVWGNFFHVQKLNRCFSPFSSFLSVFSQSLLAFGCLGAVDGLVGIKNAAFWVDCGQMPVIFDRHPFANPVGYIRWHRMKWTVINIILHQKLGHHDFMQLFLFSSIVELYPE